MAIVTTYSTLKTEIADILNRVDLADAIENFIQRAEASLKRDDRAKLLVDLTPLAVSSEEVSMPDDFGELYSVAHDGPNYFGPLEQTDLGGLTKYKALLSGNATGVPAAVAVREDGTGAVSLVFAPEPNATFNLQAQYWAELTALNSGNPTNRWLERHPDIYIYAALVESAPYLKDDQRIQVRESQLEKRLERMGRQTQRRAFSGEMVDEPRLVF
jgi:hypothetical protein